MSASVMRLSRVLRAARVVQASGAAAAKVCALPCRRLGIFANLATDLAAALTVHFGVLPFLACTWVAPRDRMRHTYTSIDPQ
jgi:hypothetical protein